MTREERHAGIVKSITEFNELFEVFGKYGRPVFSEAIPTACITFDLDGNPLSFVWNPYFFDSCSDYKASFVLCHEMLHIFLRHGKRGLGLTNGPKLNICMDLSINHMLIDEFGFTRSMIEGWEDLCWRDTVFNTFVPELPSFENYYALDDKVFNNMNPFDIHEFLKDAEKNAKNEGPENDELQNTIDDISSKIFKDLPSYGNDSAGIQSALDVKKIKRQKFNTLVKKILGSLVEKENKLMSSWASINRRLCNAAPDLPSLDKLHQRKIHKKYKCAFFLDNSGSCSGYIQRFGEVINSLDEKVFEVTPYSFDTRVFPITYIGKKMIVSGGGGTCFRCIEAEVERTNPDVVFIITDGYAGRFIPKNKEKYFWFIVEGGSDNAIKNAGTINRLSNYE